MTWDSTIEADALRQMGVERAEATTEAFYPTFSSETVARMQEVM